MAKRITVKGWGPLKIIVRDEKSIAKPVVEPKEEPEIKIPKKEVLCLSPKIIKLMEIRAESVFRPNQEDVEIVYALSGSSSYTPDMLHSLSSSEIVEEATPAHVIAYREKMVELIRKERGRDPSLIVDVHTHPNGLPYPSETDKRTNKIVAQNIKRIMPNVKIIFGVHAVSSEAIREIEKPVKIEKNIIRWCSATREHRVGFYTEDSLPQEVMIIE